MCLAVPARVVELMDEDRAMVSLGGVKVACSLALVEDVGVGDYVIVHVGYALSKLDAAEAERTLALLAEAGVTPQAAAGSTSGEPTGGDVAATPAA